ncbi:hypothetical protein PIB30_082043, partial [Stylosanthes scabra]|nr:hypothetical protein [Stylosanthes scabra]
IELTEEAVKHYGDGARAYYRQESDGGHGCATVLVARETTNWRFRRRKKETEEEESKKQRKPGIKETESSQDITKVTFGPCQRHGPNVTLIRTREAQQGSPQARKATFGPCQAWTKRCPNVAHSRTMKARLDSPRITFGHARDPPAPRQGKLALVTFRLAQNMTHT